MKTIKQAASQSAGLSHCDKCKYFKRCNEVMNDICYSSHVRGFKKGYEFRIKKEKKI